jgi:hypothetical protein
LARAGGVSHVLVGDDQATRVAEELERAVWASGEVVLANVVDRPGSLGELARAWLPVHERAYVVVIAGEVDVPGAIGGPGLAAVYEPAERHALRGLTDARLLLVLAPWVDSSGWRMCRVRRRRSRCMRRRRHERVGGRRADGEAQARRSAAGAGGNPTRRWRC